MAGVDIQAKVKRGLAKAVNATGFGEPVYLVRETATSGTPLNQPTITTEDVLLVNAIFKNIKQQQSNNTLVQIGDRELIADSDVLLAVNDKIRQGARMMYIVDIEPVEPAGVVLVHKCIVRDM